MNDCFGTSFTKSDQLLFDQFMEDAKQDEEVVERALANPLDNFELAMKPKLETLMIDRMDQNQDVVNRYLNEAEFQDVFFKEFVRRSTPTSGGAARAPRRRRRRADVRGWPGSWDCSATSGRSQRGRRRPSGGCSSRRTR